VRISIRVAAPSGAKRQDRLEGVRVTAGLTVQQRDSLRGVISVQEIHSW